MPRLYNQRRWRDRVMPAQLRREPRCRACKAEGKIVSAVEVDHIIPISKGGDPWSPDNLQSLCKVHHSMKTNCDMQGKDWRKHELRGCNPDGSPKGGSISNGVGLTTGGDQQNRVS